MSELSAKCKLLLQVERFHITCPILLEYPEVPSPTQSRYGAEHELEILKVFLENGRNDDIIGFPTISLGILM